MPISRLTDRSATRTRRRRGAASLAAWLLAMLLPVTVLAHPLGNFTVNRYAAIEVGATQVSLTYIVDMAEIPALRERSQADSDGDGVVSAAEQNRYLDEQVAQLTPQLHLAIDGIALAMTTTGAAISYPPGQANLPTQRMTLQMTAPLAARNPATLTYQDDNDAPQLGWQEVVVRPGEGIDLLESDVPQQDMSDELRSYPADLLQEPPAVNRATVRFQPAVAGQTQSSAPTGAAAITAGPARAFTDLIAIPELGFGSVLLALAAAFFWGAAHALSPGHGKTIVGAYLVGARGTSRHALFLGLTTTLTHTAGVYALGLVTLAASNYILPETLFPWLSLLSGLSVVVIGLVMVRGYMNQLDGGHGHHHDHNHEHEHEHGHEQHRHDHHGHSHLPPGADGQTVTWRSLLALGISGGLLPCPSALVVMLSAIALGRVGFGLLLILVFSLGLAGVLTAVGIAVVHAGRLVDRLPTSGRLVRLLPVASALFVTAAGLGITWQALAGVR